jgi:alpha-maltose-1-phosphate synthase
VNTGPGTSLAGALALLARLLSERDWARAESVAQQVMAQMPAGHAGWHAAETGLLQAQRGAGRLAQTINPHYAAGDYATSELAFDRAHARPGTPPPDLSDDPGNSSIHYVADGYRTDPRMIMGRQAAGESFLQGWMRHADVTGFHTTTRGPSAAIEFANTVERVRPGTPVRWRFVGGLGSTSADGQPTAQELGVGALFHPDPLIADLAWSRRAANAYSLVGISHTLSTESAMAGITALIDAPIHPWDAVICTSQAALGVLTGLLDCKCAALAERLGQPVNPPRPHLPIIPLGVDAAHFAAHADQRAALRARLGIAPDDLVVLARGRICRDHKGHPVPMLRAVGLAATSVPQRRWHLVVAGWFADAQEQTAFANWQPLAAPAHVHVVDGREPSWGQQVWAMADIFVSLPDNVQETFGLTPLEAMAAGLPCVVSDWNGYKDTVRDGVDGFRIPTWLRQSGGTAIANRFGGRVHPYRDYLREIAAACAVDVGAAAQALITLGSDAELRRRMGAAGQERARAVYDWSVIIPRYQQLFRDLATLRKAAPNTLPHRQRPAYPDPLALFAHYATHPLSANTRVLPVAARMNAALWLAESQRLPGGARPDTKLAQSILGHLSSAGEDMASLATHIGEADMVKMATTLLWLAKGGLVRLEP